MRTDINYMELTADLLDSIDDKNIIESVLSKSKEVKEIAKAVRELGMYELSLENSEAFYKEMSAKANGDKDVMVRMAFEHFIDRVNQAPTNVHLRGAVILLIPLLDRCIDEKLSTVLE